MQSADRGAGSLENAWPRDIVSATAKIPKIAEVQFSAFRPQPILQVLFS